MSLWQTILESLNDTEIYDLSITNLPYDDDYTVWFEMRLGLLVNDIPCCGQSYMKYPAKPVDSWDVDYLLEELQNDLVNKLDEMAHSQDIVEVLESTAIVSAVHSVKPEYPNVVGDVTQVIEEDNCVLLVDNYGITGINRSLDGFIDKINDKNPGKTYVLHNNEMYEVAPDSAEMSYSDEKLSDIDPDRVLVSNCFYPSAKEMDESLTQFFDILKPKKTCETALFGPIIMIDPRIIFNEYIRYGINTYATARYEELNTANPIKNKVIYTSVA